MSAPQVVVADHPGAFRSGVSSYLAEDTRYDVVEVDDADGLVAAGRAGTADVILIDSGMAQSAELQNALAAVGASPVTWRTVMRASYQSPSLTA